LVVRTQQIDEAAHHPAIPPLQFVVFREMTSNGKSNGASSDRKNDQSAELKQFRQKMDKLLAELDGSLRRSREARARADAALKIGSR
jgi:hypothetical protein